MRWRTRFMTPSEREAYFKRKEAAQGAAGDYEKGRNQQYIDWLDRNTSMGRLEEYEGQNFNTTANAQDLVF